MLKCEQKLLILPFQEEITEVPAGYVDKISQISHFVLICQNFCWIYIM